MERGKGGGRRDLQAYRLTSLAIVFHFSICIFSFFADTLLFTFILPSLCTTSGFAYLF